MATSMPALSVPFGLRVVAVDNFTCGHNAPRARVASVTDDYRILNKANWDELSYTLQARRL